MSLRKSLLSVLKETSLVKAEDPKAYAKLASTGFILAHPVKIKGHEKRSDNNIPYHATIKFFDKEGDDPQKAHEAASKLEHQHIDPKKVGLSTKVLKDRNGNDVYAVGLHGHHADKLKEQHDKLAHLGHKENYEWGAHISVPKAVHDEIKEKGHKTAHDAGIEFGHAELRRGPKTLHTYKPKDKMAKSELEPTSEMHLTHYSPQAGLKHIDPKFKGSGVDARTKGRDTWHPHSFYYMHGTAPEEVVASKGKSKYHVKIDPKKQPIYDIGGDPKGLVRQSIEENQSIANMDAVHEKLKQHGFHGFHNTTHPSLSNVVALYHPQPVHSEESTSKSEEDNLPPLMKPYTSEAQRRWAHTTTGKKALGGEAGVHEWDEATKGKKLPEKVSKSEQAPEGHAEVHPNEFHQHLGNAITSSPKVKEFVHHYQPHEYAGMKTFLHPDKKSGFAVKPDGDIVSVFSTEKGRGDQIVQHAIKAGGNKLDAFDGYLPKLYAKHGFKEYKREKNWTPGGPDVVYMKLHDKSLGKAEEWSTKPYGNGLNSHHLEQQGHKISITPGNQGGHRVTLTTPKGEQHLSDVSGPIHHAKGHAIGMLEHHMGIQKNESLEKGAVKNALTGIAMGAALAAPQATDANQTKQPSRAPASISAPKSNYSREKMLNAISQVESSGGKNVKHKPTSMGTAYGRWAVMPDVVHDTIRLNPDLKRQHSKVLNLNGNDLHHYLQDNPKLEQEIVNRHMDRLEHHFGQDPDKIAYAWNHGVRGTNRSLQEKQDITKHPYVQKFRQAYKGSK